MKKLLSILLFLLSLTTFSQHHTMLMLASQTTTPAAWYDFRYATYKQSFSVSGQEANSHTMFFKPDGTIMYVIGTTGDDINQYALSTAWEVNSASYTKVQALNSLGGTTEGTPQGMFISPDGLYLYVVGQAADNLKQFTFGTAWDVATLSYTREFSVSGQTTNESGVFFRPDGTYFYITDDTGNAIDYYSLSTAWDISTASYVNTKSISGQSALPRESWFKSDGTEMYLLDGDATDFRVHKYTMSTPWDIANLTYSTSRDLYNTVTFTETAPTGLFFKGDDCSRMYIVGTSSDAVWQYNISNAWDIDYLAYEQSVNPPVARDLYGISISSNGSKLYGRISSTADSIYEFSLSTAYDISTISYDRQQQSGNTGTGSDVCISSDGVYLAALNAGGLAIMNTLTTAYNISAFTTSTSFDPSATDANMNGVFVKPNGLSMYLIGNSNDILYTYNTSVAWNFATANVTAGTTKSMSGSYTGEAVCFHPEGTIMYILDSFDDVIEMWYLTTAWDISTAGSVLKSADISGQDVLSTGLTFSYDGTKMYMSGLTNDLIFQYKIE